MGSESSEAGRQPRPTGVCIGRGAPQPKSAGNSVRLGEDLTGCGEMACGQGVEMLL
jgi:hypothetical protein